jgi:ASC-1-like (ASCH) protein
MKKVQKQYTLRFRAVNKDTFENIKSGKKKVETRAASQKYKDIQKGDTIVLSCGAKKYSMKVKKSRVFKSIPAMLKVYRVKDIEPNFRTMSELREAYYSYPNYKEKIKQFGLVALELE